MKNLQTQDVQEAHHVISRQKLLQELCLLVHDSFDDKLVILGNVEHRTTGSWVRQLNQWLITQRILQRIKQEMLKYIIIKINNK